MPTAKQIDAILPYLELFSREGISAGTWSGEPGYLPSFSMAKEVSEFLDALYQQGWISDTFNWPDWQESAARYLEDSSLVASADVQTIRKLLTTHARKERFCEGHFAAVIESGHIAALLRRLKKIRVFAASDC